jgi:hypothetical protein
MPRSMRFTSVALALALVVPAPAAADGHLVTTAQIADRLETVRATRHGDRLKVDALLSSPAGSRAAAAYGLDTVRLRSSLATLSDDELRDLAARAEALETDPVAGASRTLIIIGVVLLVGVLLLALIVKSCKEQGAECLNDY